MSRKMFLGIVAIAVALPLFTNAASFTRTLSLGSQGSDVTDLQRILKTQGHLTVPPTGYFGLLTLSALAQFQRAHNLPGVGYAGPLTRNILNTIAVPSHNSALIAALLAQVRVLQAKIDAILASRGGGNGGGGGGTYLSASLNSSPSSIIAGASATLTWSSTNTDSCTGTNFTTGGTLSGSITVSPATTTTYTVSCTGVRGSASAATTVTVSSISNGQLSLTITPGREFAADSYVYKPLADNAAIDSNSAAMVADFLDQVKKYYGHVDINTVGNTPPVFIVGPNQPTVAMKHIPNGGPVFSPLEDRLKAVPLPDNFNARSGGDDEAVVYQPSTGTLWEFWLTQKTGRMTTDSAGRTVPEWAAAWGGRMDNIATNPGYWISSPEGVHYGTTASGIPFFAGMMTVDELQHGSIDHVLGFAMIDIACSDIVSAPAQRSDGNCVGKIPEGAILRFPANLNLDTISDPLARMIAKAIQKHGMILWDTSGVVGFRAQDPMTYSNKDPIPTAEDPYTKVGGILDCPPGLDENDQLIYSCWPPEHLGQVPWDKLQVLQLQT